MKAVIFKIVPDLNCENCEARYLDQRLTQLTEIERKIVNVKFCYLSKTHPANREFFEFVKSHQTTIKSITFESCEDLAPNTLLNILSLTENLETLKLHYCSFQSMIHVLVRSFKSLKHLELLGTNLNVLKLFSASELTSLKMKVGLVDVADLIEFISIQRELETIEVTSFSGDIFSRIFSVGAEYEGFNDKLKKLKIEYVGGAITPRTEYHFIRFLKHRGAGLKELELKGVLFSRIFVYIVTRVLSLRKLTVDAYEALKDKNLFSAIDSSSKITQLNLLQFVSTNHEESVIQALRIMEFSTGNSYQTSAIRFIHRMIDEEIVITNNLNLLLKKNPSIKMLCIKKFNFCSLSANSINKLVETFTDTEGLKEVQLEGKLENLKPFFEHLKSAPWKHLKSLTIIVRSDSLFDVCTFEKQEGEDLSWPY